MRVNLIPLELSVIPNARLRRRLFTTRVPCETSRLNYCARSVVPESPPKHECEVGAPAGGAAGLGTIMRRRARPL
ncbi:MAG: hypothetical protein ACE5HE_00330, partial [Phycisphaerae bacterium]